MVRQLRISLFLTFSLLLALYAVQVPLLKAQEFDVGGLLAGPGTAKSAEAEFEISLDKSEYQAGDEAELSIHVILPTGGFTYAQDNPTGAKPRFKLAEVKGLKAIEESFQADRKPKEVYESVVKKTALKFYKSVTWTRKYKVTGETDRITINGSVRVPICDDRSCRMVDKPISLQAASTMTASVDSTNKTSSGEGAFGEEVSSGESGSFGEEVDESNSFGEEVTESFPLFWTDAIISEGQEVVKLKSELVKSGELYELKVTADIEKGWHVYSMDPQDNAKPASFSILKLNGLEDDGTPFTPDRMPKAKQGTLGNSVVHQKYFINQIVWTKTLKPDAADVAVGVEMTAQLQTCLGETLCLRPSSFSYQLGTLTPGVADNSFGSGTASLDNEAWIKEIIIPKEDVGFTVFLMYAFLGGLILNAMPCVLPVLAIKLLSFVKQAGEDRSRIIALNGAYSVGVISVFMLLATLAVGAGYGWGELFQKTEFNIVMTCFIFAMSLSLLGLYEIPIPGLFGSAAGHQQEGLSGAFLTGVFATLLATPCSGPFLGVTLAWSVQQPPTITYLIWFTMGLGMASPYLLIGLFPGLVSWLPKPGNWMVRLKELAGFILLGTVIFLFSYMEERFKTPLLVMLLGAGFSLSIIGRAPANMISRSKYWVTRVTALVCLVVICGGAYMFGDAKGSQTLDWKPFSTAELKRLRDEGKTVLIDFSAEWCISCKTVEQMALNTKITKSFVDKHDIVTLYADYTDGDPEIKQWLEKFESESIPLTVIFPAKRPNHPIILRDLYFQGTLLMKLRKAVGGREIQTADSSEKAQTVSTE